jgi:hypothetical protein
MTESGNAMVWGLVGGLIAGLGDEAWSPKRTNAGWNKPTRHERVETETDTEAKRWERKRIGNRVQVKRKTSGWEAIGGE